MISRSAIVFRQMSAYVVAAGLMAAASLVHGQAIPELTQESRQKVDEIIEAQRVRLKIPGVGVASR